MYILQPDLVQHLLSVLGNGGPVGQTVSILSSVSCFLAQRLECQTTKGYTSACLLVALWLCNACGLLSVPFIDGHAQVHCCLFPSFFVNGFFIFVSFFFISFLYFFSLFSPYFFILFLLFYYNKNNSLCLIVSFIILIVFPFLILIFSFL